MKSKSAITLFFVFLFQNESVKMMQRVPTVAVPADPSRPHCLTEEQRADALQVIQNTVNNCLCDVITIRITCGVGDWERVSFLNMSDPSQHCPSNWTEYTSNRLRTCGRPNLNVYCQGVFFHRSTGWSYSKVCELLHAICMHHLRSNAILRLENNTKLSHND